MALSGHNSGHFEVTVSRASRVDRVCRFAIYLTTKQAAETRVVHQTGQSDLGYLPPFFGAMLGPFKANSGEMELPRVNPGFTLGYVFLATSGHGVETSKLYFETRLLEIPST
jgi:hypothetical protein